MENVFKRRRNLFLLLSAVLGLFAQPFLSAKTPEEKGLFIAREMQSKNNGFLGEKAKMEMVLIDAYGSKTTRIMEGKVMEVNDDGDKSISIFLNPQDVKGTKMLTHTHKNDDDDQWLYLPSVRRVKRISSSNKSSFDKSCQQSSDYMLFAHQRDVLKRALTSLRDRKSCLVHMPTGTGKTRTAMTLIAQWLNNNNGPVVWVTYSKELILQAANEFRKCWKHQGQYEADVRFYTGDASTLTPDSLDSFDICFTSFAKIGREASSGKSTLKSLAQHTSLVVVDEAHQALAPSYKEAIDQFVFFQNNSALLGLTATPGRTTSDQEESNIELSRLFGHSKVTLQIHGYKSPIDYLIQNGYLAKPEYEIITGEEDTGKYHIKDLISKIKDSISGGHERIIVFYCAMSLMNPCKTIRIPFNYNDNKKLPGKRKLRRVHASHSSTSITSITA